MKLKLVDVDHLVVSLKSGYVLIEDEIEVADAEAFALLEKHKGKLVQVEQKSTPAKAKVLASVKSKEAKDEFEL